MNNPPLLARVGLLPVLALLLIAAGCGEQAIEGIEYGAAGPDPEFNGAPNNDAPFDPDPAPEPEQAPEPTPDPDAVDCVDDSDCGEGECAEGECVDGDPSVRDCGEDPECEEGAPSDYDFGVLGSSVSSIVLETDPSIGADLDGDGEPDNAFGPLFGDIASLLPTQSINEVIAEAIESGDLLMGATWPDLDGTLADAEGVQTHLFGLEAGDEGFLATTDSFIPTSKTPEMRFEGTLEEGLLISGPGDFLLDFPDFILPFDIKLTEAYISGMLSRDELGVVVSEGTVAGAVEVESFLSGLNDFLISETCACLGLEGPMIDLSLGMSAEACVGQIDEDACGSDGFEETCSAAAATCSIFVPLIVNQADLDLDEDGTNDALSAFIRVEMQGAEIIGVVE